MTADNFHPKYLGVNYVGDVYGSFEPPNTDSLPDLANYGINSAAINVDFGIDAESNAVAGNAGKDNTIYDNDIDGGFTESDAHEGTVITQAVGLGMQVMVRPLIDFLPDNYDSDPHQTKNNPLNGNYGPDEFRNDYNPGAANFTSATASASVFFASYQSMIVDQASLAQADGAQLFDIGTELDQMTGPAYAQYWDRLITAVKAVYHGQLTYSALWDNDQGYWKYSGNFTGAEQGSTYITGDFSTQVSFWSQLDYIGIDEYAPLSNIIPTNAAGNPTLDQLIAAWADVPDTSTEAGQLVYNVTGGKSLIQYYEGISEELGKPLLFTELGYGNSTDAAENPAVPGYNLDGSADGASADPSLQALLYEAFFDAWQEDGGAGASNIDGVFIWNWEPNESGSDYSLSAGALEQVTTGYEQAALCYVSGTRILTAKGEKPVQDLRVGDLVATRFSGMRRIGWIGEQTFAGRFLAGRGPVRIKAGALGQGLPLRDLLVSPGHSMLLGATLVLACDLVNGVTITQDAPPALVHYINLDFGTHDCVLAEGAWSESFADGPGLRASFHNAAEFFAAYPDYVEPPETRLCAVRPLEGAALEQALLPVMARAADACVPGPLTGWLERLRPDGVLEGWARDADHTALPVVLEIWHRDTLLGEVLACRMRGDVQAAGLGSGRCGFEFTPPPGLDWPGFAVRRAADAARLRTLPASGPGAVGLAA